MCFVISAADGHWAISRAVVRHVVCRRMVTPGLELPADWLECVQLQKVLPSTPQWLHQIAFHLSAMCILVGSLQHLVFLCFFILTILVAAETFIF